MMSKKEKYQFFIITFDCTDNSDTHGKLTSSLKFANIQYVTYQ